MKTILKSLLVFFLSVTICTTLSCSKDEGNDDTSKEGTFTDSRDGKVYKTIKIGDQIWFAENLAYLPEVSRASEGSSSEAKYYVYGYNGDDVNEAMNSNNYSIHGVLYNFHAAEKVCPTGWHLPSDEEWKQLEMFLGMSQEEADEHGNRGLDEGNKLKSASGWKDGGNGNNESGFNAIPSGVRLYEGKFSVIEEWGEFWTSTFDSAGNTHAWNRYLTYDTSDVGRWGFEKSYGLSVRCVKN